jgi:hypothetical protein
MPSRRRESNPRLPAYKAGAPPRLAGVVSEAGVEPARPAWGTSTSSWRVYLFRHKDMSWERRTRTSYLRSQNPACSQVHLFPSRRPAELAAGRAQRRASAAHDGVVASNPSTMPASAGVRSPLRWLQPSQAAIVFSHVFRPPRERGRMWSTVVAWPAQ